MKMKQLRKAPLLQVRQKDAFHYTWDFGEKKYLEGVYIDTNLISAMGILKVWVAILINTSLLRVTAYNPPIIGMADINLQYVFWFS